MLQCPLERLKPLSDDVGIHTPSLLFKRHGEPTVYRPPPRNRRQNAHPVVLPNGQRRYP